MGPNAVQIGRCCWGVPDRVIARHRSEGRVAERFKAAVLKFTLGHVGQCHRVLIHQCFRASTALAVGCPYCPVLSCATELGSKSGSRTLLPRSGTSLRPDGSQPTALAINKPSECRAAVLPPPF